VPGATINRLCGSGLDAVGTAARAIKAGEAAADDRRRRGEHEPRALRHAQGRERLQPQQRGLRHHHRLALRQQADEGAYGVDSMPETAENVATDFKIEREAQDRMALASQLKAVAAQKAGFFDAEITPVTIPQKKGDAVS
jgi:acetyl-CoA acetyltransferase